MKGKLGKYLLLLTMVLSICMMVCVACTDDEEYSYSYPTESDYVFENSSLSVDLSNSQSSELQSNSSDLEQSFVSSEDSFVSFDENSMESISESLDYSSIEIEDSSIDDDYSSSICSSEESSSYSSIEDSSDCSSDDIIDSDDDSSSTSSSTSSIDIEDNSSSGGPSCGDTEHEEGEYVVDHVFITVREEPDCVNSGFERRYCTGCGLEIYYNVFDALGHKKVTIPGFASTCCTYGATESSYCERCDIDLVVSEQVPFSDHKYDWGSCIWCDLAILQFKMVKKDFQEPYAVCLGPYTDEGMKHPNARRVIIPSEVEILDDRGIGKFYPVKEIAEVAFSMHYELYSVEIGENVEKIGEAAFEGCLNLKEVYDKSKTQVTKAVSKTGSKMDGRISHYVKEEDIHYEEYDSKISFSETGCIIYTDGEDSILIGCRNTHTEVIIPEGVTEIGPFAFVSSYLVSKITIAASVNYMERYAFCYICPWHRQLATTDCDCLKPLNSVVFLNPKDWYTKQYDLEHYAPIPYDLSVPDNAFYELMHMLDYYWQRME